jgi:sugar-specific transcriptional regulator TrmB
MNPHCESLRFGFRVNMGVGLSVEAVLEDSQRVVKLYDENTGAWKFVRNDCGPTKSIELIESMLQKLGLSKNEIRVYIFLARSSERKASEISEALTLHRTETYRILRDLEKRGLVASVFEKPLKFIATPFERAIESLIEAKKLRIQQLERKKQGLIDVWLSLPHPEVEEERKEVFQILEGEEQVDFKSNEIVQFSQKEVSIFASEEDLARLYHSGFVDNLEKLPRKGLAVRLLTNDSPKSRFFAKRMKLPSVRFARLNAEDVPTFVLTDREQLLLTIRKNSDRTKRSTVAALWTNYEAFSKALEKLFSVLWNGESLLTTPPS